jgi:FlaA1/EpsC-like NDP-sugar epimerase
MQLSLLSSFATGREQNVFAADVHQQFAILEKNVKGKRVLVIGGAGSIGSSTIKVIARFLPQCLPIIDQSENNLAELVRDLRSGNAFSSSIELRTWPLDYGAPVMRQLLEEADRYDFVLNFAAIKHVRSEKDVFSLIQMFDTNILKQWRLMNWLGACDKARRYFCVSTDKAANPVNLMGASKRAMEILLFNGARLCGLNAEITSARFANVAYSDGSLLYSFTQRFEKQQPLAVPEETKRFFVSLEEAGQICLLAALFAPANSILIPKLDPVNDLRNLETLATEFLASINLNPRRYNSEGEAKANLATDLKAGSYPVIVTPLDTSGEKPFEEFVGEGESVEEIGLSHLCRVLPSACNSTRLTEFIDRIERACAGNNNLNKETFVLWMQDLVPEFKHLETGRNLDQRM